MNPLSMTIFLELEINRLADLGFAFPGDLERIVRQRAKTLDKTVVSDPTRRSNAGLTDLEECNH